MTDEDSLVEQARSMGASDAVLARVRASVAERREAAEYRVWPEHWHAVQVFAAMATQWNLLPMPRGVAYLGLRYEALPLVMAEHRSTPHRQPLERLMGQLRRLEAAARDALNQRR